MLGSYEITDVLGQGGMSVVYEARHTITDQIVALKILTPELAAHQHVKSRFVEEAKALARLDHPNIVHLYNFGEERGGFALAMQFVRGPTWERLILADEGLDWRRSTEIAIGVLRALDYAHECGIVHRDMKPSNVLIREADGVATVMDFGIAKITTSTKLTATGQTMGTVRYMSPEQVRGRDVDLRSDIYSLACTLYESLAGDAPFDGDTHFEIMTKHLSEPVPGLRVQDVECPIALERSVLKALSKKQEDRHQTAREFLDELEACLGLAPEPVEDAERAVVPRRAISNAAASAATVEVAGALTAEETGRITRPSGGRSTLWLALGAVVLAAGAVVAFIARDDSKPAPLTAAPPTDDSSPLWPEPVLTAPASAYAVDEKFEAQHVRILAREGGDIDPKGLRDATADVTRDFSEFLVSNRVTADPGIQPLNIVLVGDRAAFCHKGLYPPGKVVANCGSLEEYYLPERRTLYRLKASHAQIVETIRWFQPLNMCVHMPTAAGCDAKAIAFQQAQRGR